MRNLIRESRPLALRHRIPAQRRVVVVAGTALARYADVIADATQIDRGSAGVRLGGERHRGDIGAGNTLVGTWLAGLSTALPELVSSLAAARLGAYDLAIGNLFGSNAFNMPLFFALDLAQPGHSVFQALQPHHAISAFFGIMLMSVGLAAIVIRAGRRFSFIEPSSALIVVGYVAALVVLYAKVT